MARRTWSNWAGNERFRCEVVTPRSLEELQLRVKNLAKEGKRIRAAGGGYSWSPLVRNRDVVLSTRALAGLIRFDPAQRWIEVECGMTIQTLHELVAQRDLSLVSPTLFPRPTVGGVVATGSHGTGLQVGNFSDQILEMTLVDYRGELLTVRRGDPDFLAAQVALGTLGIVYSVKLELVPQFQVYMDRRYVPVRYVLEEFEDLQRSCEFLEMFWFPLQDKMWVYLMDSTHSDPDEETWWRWAERHANTVGQTAAAEVLIPLVAKRLPRLMPLINRASSMLTTEVSETVQKASEAFHHQKAYPLNYDLSYAVPAKDAARAWSDAINLVNEYAQAELYPVNLALHCRFTKGSAAWLAPNHERPTCWIEVATAKGTPSWREFFHEMEARWLDIPDARAHWGKLYQRGGALKARYPKMKEFLQVRERWDPKRAFLNPHLESVVFKLP